MRPCPGLRCKYLCGVELISAQPLPLPAEPPAKSLRPNSYLYDLSQLHVAPRDQVELPPEEAVNPCDYIQDQSRNWNEEFQRLLGASS